MSGGDDFRTQYGQVHDAPDTPAPEDPEEVILKLVRRHGVEPVKVWLARALATIEVEQRQVRGEARRKEIERLEKAAKEGDAAKKRLAQLITQEMGT